MLGSAHVDAAAVLVLSDPVVARHVDAAVEVATRLQGCPRNRAAHPHHRGREAERVAHRPHCVQASDVVCGHPRLAVLAPRRLRHRSPVHVCILLHPQRDELLDVHSLLEERKDGLHHGFVGIAVVAPDRAYRPAHPSRRIAPVVLARVPMRPHDTHAHAHLYSSARIALAFPKLISPRAEMTHGMGNSSPSRSGFMHTSEYVVAFSTCFVHSAR